MYVIKLHNSLNCSESVWYKNLDTPALVSGCCNFFIDKVHQEWSKMKSGLRGNVDTRPTISTTKRIRTTSQLPLFSPVTPKKSPLDALPVSIMTVCNVEFSTL